MTCTELFKCSSILSHHIACVQFYQTLFPLKLEKDLYLRFLLCHIWVSVFLNPPYGDSKKPLVYWSQESWTELIGLMEEFMKEFDAISDDAISDDAISGKSLENKTATFQYHIQTCQLHCMLAPLRRVLQEQFRQKKKGQPEVDSSIVEALL
jgi:hypothetical protein